MRGTVTNFANQQSASDGGLYSTLAERTIPAGSGLPITQTFETETTAGAPCPPPVNWTSVSPALQSNTGTQNHTPSGAWSVRINAAGTGVLTSETLNYTGYINPDVSFWFRGTATAVGTTNLYYSISGGAWVLIYTQTPWPVDSAFHQYAVNDITALNNQSSVKFKWEFVRTGGTSNSIDDIQFTADAAITNDMEIYENIASVPSADTQTLQLSYELANANDTFNVQVWNGSAWNTRGSTLNSTSWTDWSYTLLSNEVISGTVQVRFVDVNARSTPQDSILIDYLRVKGETAPIQYTLTMATNSGTTTPSVGGHTYDNGTVVDISATAPGVGTGEQYVWNGWTGTGTGSYTGSNNSAQVTMSGNITETASWIHQYYFGVSSAYDSPTGQGWYNSGSSVSSTVTRPVSGGTGIQYETTGWTGTGSLSSGGSAGSSSTGSFTIAAYSTCTWNWKTQYKLTMATNFGTTDPAVGDPWEDEGAVVDISATAPDTGAGEQYVWNGWTGTGTGSYTGTDNPAIGEVTMNSAITETASWTNQYKLTMATNFGTTDPAVGDPWEDEGAVVDISATAPGVGAGEQYVWNGWTTADMTEIADPSSISTTVTMDKAKTVTASWIHQYQLTMATNFGDTSPSVGDSWYDEGTVLDITATAPGAGAGEQYVFNGWTGTGTISYTGTDNPAIGEVTMNSAITETASWTQQYQLTMATNAGTTSPAAGDIWYDEGTVVDITATAPAVGAGEQYVFNGWTGTGTISYTGTDNPAIGEVTMNSAITETASWTQQYQLTMVTNAGTTTPSAGDHWYDAATVLTISATAPGGYVWHGWTGTGTISYTGMNNPATNAVTMNSAITENAYWTHFSGSGSGTAGNPYIITTVEELQEMNDNKTAYYILGNDIDASATSGWNSGAGFIPIGWGPDYTQENKFTGTLDGRGYKITNLYVSGSQWVGLFGYVYPSAVIENVGLENENVIGGSYVGGLVGRNGYLWDHGATILNCYSTGSVNGSGSSGGLVGLNCAIISNSYSAASVIGTNNVGGLVGNNTGHVSNCYSTGSVSYKVIGGVGGVAVGGLVGANGQDVSNCYSTGPVSGIDRVGGLVGNNTGGVHNSLWDNQTSGQSTSGGILGYHGTGKTTDNMKDVRTFTDNTWSTGLDTPWDFVGNPYTDVGNENIWNIASGINNGYPFLAWQVTLLQYQLTMATNAGTTDPAVGDHVYNEGTVVDITATAPTAGTGERYVFNGWTTADMSEIADPSSISTTVTMDKAKTVTASWIHQYQLTMATNAGTTDPTAGDHWYDASTVVDITATAPGVVAGEQYVFNGWTTADMSEIADPSSISTTVTMDKAKTVTASWTHQYQLTMATNFGTTTPGVGVAWYNAGTQLTISATAPIPGAGEQYVWNGWTGVGNGNYTGIANPANNAVTMNGPITETASWTHQYTFNWTGTATFRLENMYKVNLYKDNLWLYQGSKLVVKFYKYDGVTLQTESVIHENWSIPWHVVPENENVSQPLAAEGYPAGTVQIARLVLTTDDTGNIISTIASFTVRQGDIRVRYGNILRVWGDQPGQQSAFRTEIGDIMRQWSSAPT